MATEAADKRIIGYPNDPPRERKALNLTTYEYEFPFNYPNVVVDRVWVGGERHGIELFPIKTTDGSTATTQTSSDWIVIEEDHPMVQVAVIGSACTPPGSILVECDTLDSFRHDGENERAVSARFRVDNLWGMHLRADLLATGRLLPRATRGWHELRRAGDSSLPPRARQPPWAPSPPGPRTVTPTTSTTPSATSAPPSPRTTNLPRTRAPGRPFGRFARCPTPLRAVHTAWRGYTQRVQ